MQGFGLEFVLASFEHYVIELHQEQVSVNI